jgi:hypothetical protein
MVHSDLFERYQLGRYVGRRALWCGFSPVFVRLLVCLWNLRRETPGARATSGAAAREADEGTQGEVGELAENPQS